MPAEYSLGYRKPPVHTRFQKGQSGNPGGRPGVKKIRRRKFAQMLDAAMCQSTELVAMTLCASNYAATAKGMALDCVRGKTATIRLVFSLLDELDHAETDGRQRRGFDRKLEEMEAADEAAAAYRNEQETEIAAAPVSQGDIEEEPRPMWEEYASETPGSTIETPPQSVSRPATAGRPDETDSASESEKKILLDGEPQSARSWVARSAAGHDMEGVGRTNFESAASLLTERSEQGLKTESERQFLAVSRRVPSEKELRRCEERAEMERGQLAYESARAKVKAFAEKHGYTFPGTASMEPVKDAPLPLTEGRSQGITNPHPEEGPHKRALRARFERLAWAEREEAARKVALAAKAVPLTPALSPPPTPRLRRTSENSGPAEALAQAGKTGGEGEPEPLPDFSIWMRGQQARR